MRFRFRYTADTLRVHAIFASCENSALWLVDPVQKSGLQVSLVVRVPATPTQDFRLSNRSTRTARVRSI